MSAPRFAPVDDDTASLLDLIAEDPRVEHDYRLFLNACEEVALGHGIVTVNAVRSLLTATNGDLRIRPQRLSAFWRKAELDGHLARTGEWDICQGSGSGNNGRPQPRRRWVS